MTLRVLHLGSSDIRGGAARGAYWLHRALLKGGIGSHMLVDRKFTDDQTVTAPANGNVVVRRLRAIAERAPLIPYRTTDESFWSTNWVPSAIPRAVRRIAPDIVHVHWGGGGFLPIGALAQFGCPVVWTLRDMWPFTGGCHYTAGCDRYETACGACPQLRSAAERDLSRQIFDRKRRAWRDVPLWPVPISHWLAERAQASPLLGRYPLEVIPNGVDTGLFHPPDPHAARIDWNLPADRRLILFGALNATRDSRKGYAQLRDALRALAAGGLLDRHMLVVFGADRIENAADLGIEVRAVGHIEDDRRLAALYGAADVMVAPSLQEAFGKTLIEAMACGTPVVAFAHGGPADIVAHGETGYLARPFDANDLAAGIAWCLATTARPAELGLRARARVERLYDIDVVAARYADLYARIGRRPARRAA